MDWSRIFVVRPISKINVNFFTVPAVLKSEVFHMPTPYYLLSRLISIIDNENIDYLLHFPIFCRYLRPNFIFTLANTVESIPMDPKGITTLFFLLLLCFVTTCGRYFPYIFAVVSYAAIVITKEYVQHLCIDFISDVRSIPCRIQM